MRSWSFIFILIASACANITTPSGGPKDLLPPEMIRAIPENKQTNFKGKSVELTFDEAVKLNNPKEEIIISPSPGKEVIYKVKGYRVTITPENGWRDSTTYSLQFREGVQDITENNSPLNLKIAFSTGDKIDSLRITGKVTDVLKGVPVEKITVAIYQQDTFNLFTDAPEYFTKTNKSGRFSLENIKAGDYRLYAFDDKNKNLKVESRTERYGFLSGKTSLFEHVDSLSMPLIMMDSRPLKLSSIRHSGSVTRLRFNKAIVDYKIQCDSSVTSAFGDNQAEINIWSPPVFNDSLKIQITASDSIDYKIDSTFYLNKAGKLVKEEFKWSAGEPRVDAETGKFSTRLSFTKPLSRINFDSLFIELDTINKVFFNNKDLVIDERKKQITLTKEIDKKTFANPRGLKLSLKSGSGFVYSIENDTSKRQAASITIYWPERTGILLIQTATQEKNYIIQLIDPKGTVVSSIYNTPKYTFKNLNPDNYQLRIIIDTNNNKQWDPGNVTKDIMPEKVVFYTAADGKTVFPIRANWELGPLILKF